MWTRHRKRTFWAVAALFLSLICVVFLTGQQCELVITRADDGREWSYLLPERQFSLCFTHSVMKTPVEEIYIVDSDGLLVLVETHYQSYGVGLPFLPEEGELVVQDGHFVLQLRREVGSFNMVVSPLAEHSIKIGERAIPFSELIGSDSARVSVAARERLIWAWDKGRAA